MRATRFLGKQELCGQKISVEPTKIEFVSVKADDTINIPEGKMNGVKKYMIEKRFAVKGIEAVRKTANVEKPIAWFMPALVKLASGPRTESKCGTKYQCYWYKPNSLANHGYGDYDAESDQRECIHNTERFYNILAHWLSKRGKKDFAITIKYQSAAPKVKLPFGSHGPAIVGHLEDPYRHLHGGGGYGVDERKYGNQYDNDYPSYEGGHDDYNASQYRSSGDEYGV